MDATRARAGIDQWPANALRHGFASYWLAKFEMPCPRFAIESHDDRRSLCLLSRSRYKRSGGGVLADISVRLRRSAFRQGCVFLNRRFLPSWRGLPKAISFMEGSDSLLLCRCDVNRAVPLLRLRPHGYCPPRERETPPSYPRKLCECSLTGGADIR